MTHIRTRLVGLILLLLTTMPAMAQIPRTMNYQGSLKDAVTHEPVDGSRSMTFELFDVVTGGTHLWTETRDVSVTNGIYSVILGSSAPLNLAFDRVYYLQVSIDGTVLEPRQQLTSVPYAQRAAMVDGITVNNGKVGIGTSDPQQVLDVDGYIRLTGYLDLAGTSKRIRGGSPDHVMSIYPNTDAYNSRAFIEFWGEDAIKAGQLTLGGTYIDLYHGSTTEGWGNVGMRLTSDGKVGIGTTTPTQKLDVNGHLTLSGDIMGETDSNIGFFLNTNMVDSRSYLQLSGYNSNPTRVGEADLGGTNVNLRYGSTTTGYGYIGLRLLSNGNVGIGTMTPQYKLDVNGIIRGTSVISSDLRLKKDIAELDGALARIITLRGTRFHLKPPEAQSASTMDAMDRYAMLASASAQRRNPHDDRLHLGVIAQEVEQVFPEAVFTDDTGYKSVAYHMLIAPLIEAVKELNAQNEALSAEIEALKTENAGFERRLKALEAARK